MKKVLIFLAFLLFVFASKAEAADLYWYSTGDTSWYEVANWWQDSGHTVQADNPPLSGESVALLGSVIPIVDLDNIDWVNPQDIDASITGIIFTSTDAHSVDTSITGSTTFRNISVNAGTVNGHVNYFGTGYNTGTIDGDAIFFDNATNQGVVSGNITFKYLTAVSGSVTSSNGCGNGDVGGTTYDSVGAVITTWVFNDYNYCPITGDVIINGYGGNSSTINGNATFNGVASNIAGTINGNAIFNFQSVNGDGTINGNATFNEFSSNYGGTVNGDAIFNADSIDGGSISGTATFANASGGVMTLTDSGLWRTAGGSSNVGIDNIPITAWVFNGTSVNDGEVTGNATFNDDSVNYRTVDGDATFNDYSANQGTVGGTATFNNRGVAGTLSVNNLPSNLGVIASINKWGGEMAHFKGGDTVNINKLAVAISNLEYSGISIIDFNLLQGALKLFYANSGIARMHDLIKYDDVNLFNYTTIVGRDDSPITSWISGYQNTGEKNFGYLQSFDYSSGQTYHPGDSISFNLSMYADQDHTDCDSCTYYAYTVPQTTLSINKTDNDLSGSFSVDRVGTYSLVIGVSDGTHTVIRNYPYFIVASGSSLPDSSARYYMRNSSARHGQSITGNGHDTGILSLDPITDGYENRYCTNWVQYSVDQISPVIPYQTWISHVDNSIYFRYAAPTDGGMGIERFNTETNHNDKTTGVLHYADSGSLQADSISIDDVNWPIATPHDWYELTVKLVAPAPEIYSSSTNLSYSDIAYKYSNTPFVKPISSSDDNVILLSATAPVGQETTSASIVFFNTLEVATTTNIYVSGLASRYNFAVTNNGQSLGTHSSDSDGHINISFTTESNATSTIAISSLGPIPTVSVGGGGGSGPITTYYPIQANTASTSAMTASSTVPTFCPIGFTCYPTKVSSSIYSFGRDLRFGDTNNDVKELQKYLNTHGYLLALTGAGSLGKETNYFGLLTKNAVMKFQKANKLPVTGFFGPLTRGVITKLK